jgi:hypothetical protein
MKQRHRTAHRTIWIILAILIAAGFTLALVQRKPQKKKAALAPAILAVAFEGAHAGGRT